MKKGSKIFALFLAVVMVVTLSVVCASAEDAVTAPYHTKVVNDNGDGTFDVTLTVTGDIQTQSGVASSTATDVVLVIDNSGSMDGSWTDLVTATDVMMSTILADGKNNQVSVIGYADNAWIESFNGSNWTSSKDDVVNAVSGMDEWGLTYAASAIEYATQVLGTGRADAKKVVVFMSDGYPFDDDDALEAKSTLTSTYPDATVYSIGVGYCDDDFMIAVAGSESNYFYAEDAAELSKAFGDVAITIENSFDNVVVIETINDYAELTGDVTFTYAKDSGDLVDASVVSGPYADYYDAESRTIVWNVADGGKLDGEYTLAYTVKASQKAIDEFSETGYPNVGDENTDADAENITSSGKKGFFFSDGVITFAYNGVDGTDVFANPVIQVPSDTPVPESPKTGDFAPVVAMLFIGLLPLAGVVTFKAVKKVK